MQLKNISSKVTFLKVLQSLGILGVIVSVFVGLFLKFQEYQLMVSIVYWVILGPISLLLIIYPFLFYKRYLYCYNSDRVFIKRGVFFKYEIYVPIIQMQDIHLVSGPIMQLLGLDSVILSTAGSNHTISYLPKDDAKKMVEDVENFLKNKMKVSENNEEIL